MKKIFTFLLILTTVCLIAAGCADKGATLPVVESVTILSLPTKTEYLKDEEFNFAGGKISVKYTDGEENIIDMTKEMCYKADTSTYGKHTIYVNVTVDKTNYELSFDYNVVFENAKIQQFADACNSFCSLTEIEFEDVAGIRKALKDYNKLSEENKTFIQENAPLLVEKVNTYVRYALPVYEEQIKATANDIVRGINPMLYTEGSYTTLTGYFKEFVESEFVDFDEVDDKFETFTNRVSYIPKRNISIEDLRSETAEYLKNRVKRDVYSVVVNGLFDSTLTTTEVDYSESESIKNVLDGLSTATIEDLDAGYIEIINTLENCFVQEFKAEAKQSLANLFIDWEKAAAEKLSLWTNDSISLSSQWMNISFSYLEDNRWWIPMPYRLTSLRKGYAAKIDSAQSLDELNAYYDEFAFEISRAVMERNIEMVYAIDRNLNAGYDRGDALYWGNIANYWGASATQQFIYDGLLDEYVGQIYGSSDSNPYRLASILYNRDIQVKDLMSLPEKYTNLLEYIKPDPKAITNVTITTQPTKLIYQIGEQVTLEGGKITVDYNDLTTEVVDMAGEKCTMETADTSTPGSKTVNVIVRTNGEEKIIQITYTVKGDAKWDELIDSIADLDEESVLEDVKTAVVIYDAFGEESAEFKSTFVEDYNKLCAYQAKFIVEYATPIIAECDVAYETMPYYIYSEQDRTTVDAKYTEMKEAITAAAIFADVDSAVETFHAYMGSLTAEQADIATVKEKLSQSANRVATVTVYDFTSENALDITITEKSVSLAEDQEVAAQIATLTSAINTATDVESAIVAYQTGIKKVYDVVLTAYAKYATQEVKNLVDLMRNTVKYVWENDGFEGSDQISVDYTVDVWEYLWYTPDCYKVTVMLSKISVEAGASKQFTYEAYQAAYFDMMRSVMYRNMFTIFQYQLSKGEDVEGFRWSTVCSANGAAGLNPFPYDGVLKDYQGKIITVEFRLWGWGYAKDWKVTTLDALIEKYIVDMDNFI